MLSVRGRDSFTGHTTYATIANGDSWVLHLEQCRGDRKCKSRLPSCRQGSSKSTPCRFSVFVFTSRSGTLHRKTGLQSTSTSDCDGTTQVGSGGSAKKDEGVNKNFEFGHLPELEEIEERALDLLTDPDILDRSAAIAILTRDLRVAGLDLKSSKRTGHASGETSGGRQQGERQEGKLQEVS